MGDHRGDSADSRAHQDRPYQGTISEDDVVGRAFTVAWPVGRWRTSRCPAHSRMPGNLPELECCERGSPERSGRYGLDGCRSGDPAPSACTLAPAEPGCPRAPTGLVIRACRRRHDDGRMAGEPARRGAADTGTRRRRGGSRGRSTIRRWRRRTRSYARRAAAAARAGRPRTWRNARWRPGGPGRARGPGTGPAVRVRTRDGPGVPHSGEAPGSPGPRSENGAAPDADTPVDLGKEGGAAVPPPGGPRDEGVGRGARSPRRP
ncbi:hypothetical protein ACU686_38940 [Yinghuangia aomiensis]